MLRGLGYSLRAIAASVGVRRTVIEGDLRDWAREHPGQLLPGGPQAQRDKRMAAAVQLRAQGLTLRQIAAELFVHHQTIANDLARWDRTAANVARLPSNPLGESGVPGPAFRQADSTAGNVIELRRTS